MGKNKQLLSKGALWLTAIIWGWGFVFSQAALDRGFSAASSLLGKFGIAAVLFTVVYGRQVFKLIRKRDILPGVAIGVLLAGSFLAQTYGLKLSTPSNNALITAAYVVITPFLWRFVSKKRVRPVIYGASVLCLAGVAVLSVNLEGGFSLQLGDMLTLLCAFLFALQMVATETALKRMDWRVLLFLQFATAAVASFVVFLFTDGDYTPFTRLYSLAPVLYLGALSTGLCYFLQTTAQRYVESHTAAMILVMESPLGAVFSVVAGFDRMSWRLALGLVLVASAVILPEAIRDKVLT